MVFTDEQLKDFCMSRCYSLDGQTAVVTGGSTGLGLAITRCLVSAGAKVVVLSYESEEQACASLKEFGDKTVFYQFDITDTAHTQETVSYTHLAVARDFDNRGHSAPHHIPSARNQKGQVAAAGDQIRQPFVVIWICNAKLHPVGIRRGIEQPQARMSRPSPHLQNPFNGTGTAFYDSAHAFLLDCGKTACKIPRTYGILAQDVYKRKG